MCSRHAAACSARGHGFFSGGKGEVAARKKSGWLRLDSWAAAERAHPKSALPPPTEGGLRARGALVALSHRGSSGAPGRSNRGAESCSERRALRAEEGAPRPQSALRRPSNARRKWLPLSLRTRSRAPLLRKAVT